MLSTAFRPGIRVSVPGTQERISLPLEIVIEDNGPGVPEDLLPNLFDPFVTTKPTGSGLGLALVAKIVGDHGGVIECDSRGGPCSASCCRWQAAPFEAADEEVKEPNEVRTILVADDDAAIRMVLNQALTRAGYEVRPTGNLSTMWNWVAAGEGDLLITDVAMPDGNAFDIMPKIKKLRPDLPIIVMSAQNTFMTAIRANEVGAYEYLPKPFDITEVLGRRPGAVRRPGGRRSTTQGRKNSRARPCRWSAARPRCRTSTARWRA